MNKKYIYCKFCDYKTVKFYTRKNGTISTPTAAAIRLKNHVERKHPEEFKKFEEQRENHRLSLPSESYE